MADEEMIQQDCMSTAASSSLSFKERRLPEQDGNPFIDDAVTNDVGGDAGEEKDPSSHSSSLKTALVDSLLHLDPNDTSSLPMTTSCPNNNNNNNNHNEKEDTTITPACSSLVTPPATQPSPSKPVNINSSPSSSMVNSDASPAVVTATPALLPATSSLTTVEENKDVTSMTTDEGSSSLKFHERSPVVLDAQSSASSNVNSSSLPSTVSSNVSAVPSVLPTVSSASLVVSPTTTAKRVILTALPCQAVSLPPARTSSPSNVVGSPTLGSKSSVVAPSFTSLSKTPLTGMTVNNNSQQQNVNAMTGSVLHSSSSSAPKTPSLPNGTLASPSPSVIISSSSSSSSTSSPIMSSSSQNLSSGTAVNVPLITRPNIVNSSAIQSTTGSTSTPIIINTSSVVGGPVSSSPSIVSRANSTPTSINMNMTMNSLTPGKQQTVLLTQPDGSKVPVVIQTSSSGQTSIVGNSQLISTASGNVLLQNKPPGTASTLPPGIQQTGQQVLVSNPNVMPQMVLTTRPGGQPINLQQLQQQQMAGQQQQGLARQLAPRPNYIVNGPTTGAGIRFGPQGLRGGPATGPQATLVQQGLTIPSHIRGPLLIRTEHGLQLVNVTGPVSGQASGPGSTPTSLPAGLRFQTVQQGMRPPTGMTVNLAGPPGSVTTIRPGQGLQQHPGQPQVQMTQQGIQQQQQQTPNMPPTQPLSIQTTQANSQAASSTPSQMSPNTAKKKCKNFLSTLIKLANDQPEQVATNVRKLIQGLIDGMIMPEDFTDQLQRELKSSPQPCLVPFLKKSLPHLRQSLAVGELTIEGVQPPSRVAVAPGLQQQLPHIQLSGQRPGIRFLTPMGLAQGIHPGMTFVQRPGMGPSHVMTAQGTSVMSSNLRSPAPTIPSLTLDSKDTTETTTTKGKKEPAAKKSKAKPKKEKESKEKSEKDSKSDSKKVSTSLREDDDINDVAAMGGVNLQEESQRMAAAANEVGTQIRSCKDDTFVFASALSQRINRIASRFNLEDNTSLDVVSLVSHAAQERLKTLIERLGIIAEHRLENMKMNPKYEVIQDVRAQVKFLEELDKLEKKRHEEQEREMLLRAAKSRSKLEDPEQLKLKQKAKEMQRAEMEEARQREANETALLAIGPRKKMKLDALMAASSPSSSNASAGGLTTTSASGTSAVSPFNGNQQNNPSSHFSNSIFSTPFSSGSKIPIRRMKRVHMKDLLFLMEQDRCTSKSNFLYRSYAK